MGEMEDPAPPSSGAPHPWLGDNTTHCAKGAPSPAGCSLSCRVLPVLQGAPPPSGCSLSCRVNELRKVTPPWPGVCPQ